MNLLLDRPGLSRIYFHRTNPVRQEVRQYYLSEPPALAIIVSRIGTLSDYAGAVVDVLIGHELGVSGFCVNGYARKRHGKLTILREVSGSWEKTLSDFLDETETG